MEGVGVTHIPIIKDALAEGESSDKPRRTGPGSRAKNYKKFKHKNETSKSARDLNIFVDGGTEKALSANLSPPGAIRPPAQRTRGLEADLELQRKHQEQLQNIIARRNLRVNKKFE